jgi:hypothetical protein
MRTIDRSASGGMMRQPLASWEKAYFKPASL